MTSQDPPRLSVLKFHLLWGGTCGGYCLELLSLGLGVGFRKVGFRPGSGGGVGAWHPRILPG